jgi:hypothetical protein
MKARKQTPAQSRPASNLASNLDKGLLQYAAAAGAAGVGLLALSPKAEAKVIYTATNVPITVNGPFVQLDVNNDGTPDFSFYNYVESGDARTRPTARPPLGFYAHAFGVQPAQSANEVGAITSFTKVVCAAEVPQGKEINASKNFIPGRLDLFAVAGDYTSPGSLACPWVGRGNKGGFLALKFVVNGATHYGWARITLAPNTVPTLTGYAYEDAPNVGLKAGAIKGPDENADASQPAAPAPQPAGLGALAKGASGLATWRVPMN